MNCPSDWHVLPMYTKHHMSILVHLTKRCLYTSLYTATTEDIRTSNDAEVLKYLREDVNEDLSGDREAFEGRVQ